MSRGKDGPTRVGELVGSLLEEKGLQEQVERVAILDKWDDLVGDRIARVTHAKSLSGGTLFVEVKSSAWMSELDFMKGEILEKLNEHSGAPIEKLVFLLAGS